MKSREIKEIKKQIISEILKGEIIGEIKPKENKKSFLGEGTLGRFIAGFILTGVIGTWLSSCWQSKQWAEQQVYTKNQKKIERNYELTDEITVETAKTFTAVEDILQLFQNASKQHKLEEEKERRKFWRKTSREWRVNSKKLFSEITANFKDPNICKLLTEIIDDRRYVGNYTLRLMNNLDEKTLAIIKKYKKENKEIKNKNLKEKSELYYQIKKYTDETEKVTGENGKLRKLAKLMNDEIENIKETEKAYWFF